MTHDDKPAPERFKVYGSDYWASLAPLSNWPQSVFARLISPMSVRSSAETEI
jgi:hypothetical protein